MKAYSIQMTIENDIYKVYHLNGSDANRFITDLSSWSGGALYAFFKSKGKNANISGFRSHGVKEISIVEIDSASVSDMAEYLGGNVHLEE